MSFPSSAPPSDYALALGARLRAVRKRSGMSLGDVERKSRGEWKAVVAGSYERGQRAITAERLVDLCKFYGTDAGEVLTGEPPVRGPEFLRSWLAPLMELTDAEMDHLIRSARKEGRAA